MSLISRSPTISEDNLAGTLIVMLRSVMDQPVTSDWLTGFLI
jgi:hypothetical protein